MGVMPPVPKKPRKPVTDPTAALRQQRRRRRLKRVEVLLTDERADKLNSLLEAGYAPDQQAVLAKGLDEAYERAQAPRSRHAKAKTS